MRNLRSAKVNWASQPNDSVRVLLNVGRISWRVLIFVKQIIKEEIMKQTFIIYDLLGISSFIMRVKMSSQVCILLKIFNILLINFFF